MIFLLQLPFKTVVYKNNGTVAVSEVFQMSQHYGHWVCCKNLSRTNDQKKNLEVHHDICLQCGPDLSTVCQGYLY